MFAVCSLSCGEEYKKIVNYGRLNKINYCKRHNYVFIEDEKYIDQSRDLPWSKIPLLRQYLSQYDYILWLDADTYITNPAISIQDMIEKMGNNLIMYQKDPFIWVNTGFILFKNDTFCHTFLEECYKHTDQICWEQGAIDLLYRMNWNGSQSRIKILEHSEGFNQYWHTWNPENFLIHFPGCHEPELKTDALDLMMKRFCPYRREEETEEEYRQRKNSIQVEILQKEYEECRNRGKCLPLLLYNL